MNEKFPLIGAASYGRQFPRNFEEVETVFQLRDALLAIPQQGQMKGWPIPSWHTLALETADLAASPAFSCRHSDPRGCG